LVEVRVRKDSRNRLSSFYAAGHAGWADSGQDVVCAAVSALLQAAWLGLEEVAKVEVEGSRAKGRLELSWPEAAREDPAVAAIVATAQLAIERIATQYPSHVRVIVEPFDG
jgi:uncharacterized protein YsxB (DUF464 family)